MKISTKGRYALRMLLDLAQNHVTAMFPSRTSPSGRRSPKNIWSRSSRY